MCKIEETREEGTNVTEKRIAAAIRECINKGILKEYLLRKESEVVGMLSDEYNYEENIRVQREEAAEEGREEGRQEGAFTATVNLYRDRKITAEDAAKNLDMTVEEFVRRVNVQ